MSLYLGLDSSTQGLKGIIIDTEKQKIVFSEAVNFGKDLPEFRCQEGVLDNPNPLVKHSDPLLWAAALDLLLERMNQKNAPMDKVEGISGSGQQHGSVYLNHKFEGILENLSTNLKLPSQLAPALSRKTSPIWMDSSTSQECREISDAIGARLQDDTGSPAIERFTGPQIRKFWKETPKAYEETAVIHLVSSFMASLLCGKNAPMDFGDGAGMNLLNLKTLKWDPEITEATAPQLLSKLPPAVSPDQVGGHLHRYFTRYGLKAGIPVVIWSGDNPNSLIGCGAAKPGIAVISLGTSDTFFAAMSNPKVDPHGCGHVFGNPAGGFMSLICFKNGSLARERIKDECGKDWDYFNGKACKKTSPGNDGNLMLPYFVPEITPPVLKEGLRCRGTREFTGGEASAAVKIRAVMESQALSMRLHSQWIGDDFSVVRVTGGASRSEGFCQILADVFQARLEKIAIPDSAALGAAMRAANGAGKVDWDKLTEAYCKPEEKIKPNKRLKELYDNLLEDYRQFESEVVPD